MDVLVAQRTVSKAHQFVKEGLFYAELNHFLATELRDDGYAGMELFITHNRTQINIHATRTRDVLGENHRRITELGFLIGKRFRIPEKSLFLFVKKVNNKGLSALAQAESLKFRLLNGVAVRRACYGVIRYIMECEARGCEVKVSGKVRGQRAKVMRFRDGYMIKSGEPAVAFTDVGVRSVLLRQGVLGIKVKIMLPNDPHARKGLQRTLPDVVKVPDSKEGAHTSTK